MLTIQAIEHVAVVVVDNMEQMVSFAVSYFNFVLQRNRESVALLLRLIALQNCKLLNSVLRSPRSNSLNDQRVYSYLHVGRPDLILFKQKGHACYDICAREVPSNGHSFDALPEPPSHSTSCKTAMGGYVCPCDIQWHRHKPLARAFCRPNSSALSSPRLRSRLL